MGAPGRLSTAAQSALGGEVGKLLPAWASGAARARDICAPAGQGTAARPGTTTDAAVYPLVSGTEATVAWTGTVTSPGADAVLAHRGSRHNAWSEERRMRDLNPRSVATYTLSNPAYCRSRWVVTVLTCGGALPRVQSGLCWTLANEIETETRARARRRAKRCRRAALGRRVVSVTSTPSWKYDPLISAGIYSWRQAERRDEAERVDPGTQAARTARAAVAAANREAAPQRDPGRRRACRVPGLAAGPGSCHPRLAAKRRRGDAGRPLRRPRRLGAVAHRRALCHR